jgi:hypothetical protein
MIDPAIGFAGGDIHRHATGALIPFPPPGDDPCLQGLNDLIGDVLIMVSLRHARRFSETHFLSPFPIQTPT